MLLRAFVTRVLRMMSYTSDGQMPRGVLEARDKVDSDALIVLLCCLEVVMLILRCAPLKQRHKMIGSSKKRRDHRKQLIKVDDPIVLGADAWQ